MHERDALRLVAGRVYVNVTDDCVRYQSAVSGLQRIFHCGEWTAEIRKRHAAALAGTAVMAGRPPIMWLREDGDASHGESSSELLLDALPQTYFSAAHLHGRKKLAVGQHFILLSSAADADVALNNVVEGREVSVRDRPIHIVAVAAGGFEIHIAQSVAVPAP